MPVQPTAGPACVAALTCCVVIVCTCLFCGTSSKHTGGFVQLPAELSEDYMSKNFADLEFFKVRARNGIRIALV